MLSTIRYISPHICKVLPLPKQDKVMAACVLTRMHDCENLPKYFHMKSYICARSNTLYMENICYNFLCKCIFIQVENFNSMANLAQ